MSTQTRVATPSFQEAIRDSGGRLPEPNLLGDRDVEWSWVAANLPDGPGLAVDFGAGPSWMGLLAARRGWSAIAVDLMPMGHHYAHEGLRAQIGNILELPLDPGSVGLVINCSTIEHVGLSGRYGVAEERPSADFEAMARLRQVLSADGLMLLTLPVGRDRVFRPWHRVYGRERLPRLLEGFTVLKQEFWLKDAHNRWVISSESAALDREPVVYCYGLGLYALRRACERGSSG